MKFALIFCLSIAGGLNAAMMGTDEGPESFGFGCMVIACAIGIVLVHRTDL